MDDEMTDLIGSRLETGQCSETMKDFLLFHRDNPHVYRFLCNGLREIANSGRERCGFAEIWEQCRWSPDVIKQASTLGFRLPDRFGAYYVRAILILNPEFNNGLLSLSRTKTADLDFGVRPVHGVLEEDPPPDGKTAEISRRPIGEEPRHVS